MEKEIDKPEETAQLDRLLPPEFNCGKILEAYQDLREWAYCDREEPIFTHSDQ
ncbi:MAG: hypothetical protein GW949_09550 [Spirochaetales bacterium]|nr:hypothetical protein [Spirochaetales bacterium]